MILQRKVIFGLVCPLFKIMYIPILMKAFNLGMKMGGFPKVEFCSKEYKSAMVSLFEEKSVNNNSKGVRNVGFLLCG